jgi:hypothetical protein
MKCECGDKNTGGVCPVHGYTSMTWRGTHPPTNTQKADELPGKEPEKGGFTYTLCV